MSIYIKGMEMPDYGYVCLKVFANGEVLMTKEHRGALVITGIKDKVRTAAPVPPHGRLIDGNIAEVISFEEADAEGKDFADGVLYAADFISQMPTIISAEEAHNGE